LTHARPSGRHPQSHPGPEGGPNGKQRWPGVLAMIAAAAVLVLIVVAHLTGIIGPGMHEPGGPISPSRSIPGSPVSPGGR
jgi:hypothetical protein